MIAETSGGLHQVAIVVGHERLTGRDTRPCGCAIRNTVITRSAASLR